MAGALSLFAAAPVAADHGGTGTTFLTTTLTVDQHTGLPGEFGCDDGSSQMANCSAALASASFAYEGYTVAVTEIEYRSDIDRLEVGFLGQGIGASVGLGSNSRRLTLHLGDKSFPLADGQELSAGHTWRFVSVQLGWTDGQQVQVRLTAGGLSTGVELESAAFLPSAEGHHDLVIPEGGSATFGVRLSERPTTNVTVNLGKLVAQQFHGDVNAVTVSPTTLTFTPTNYNTLQTVTVTATVDGDADHEHVIVSAQIAGGGYLANGVYVTVTDSGAAAQIGIQPTSGRESGDSTANNIPITFWLSQASTSTVTVRYRTVDGTATAGSDYTAASGTVTFAPGETRKTVNISIIDDTVEDSGETFFVELSNPSNASITPGYTRARVEILNDETGEFSVTITDNSDGGGGGGGTPTPTNNNNDNGGGSSGSGGGGSSGSGGGGSSGSGGGGSSGSGSSGSDSSGSGSSSSGGGGGGSSRPAPSSRAALSGLYATPLDEDGNPGKGLALSPAFTPSATSYTLDVPYTTATLDILPGLTSGTAAVGVRSDGSARPFPAAQSYRVPLRPGETTVIEITVTAEDGQRTRTYTLSATRAAPDTDPSLPALVVTGNDDSDVNLSPVFSPDNTDYEASLSRYVNELTLTFPHHKGSITVNTVPVPPGGALILPAGTPAITIDSTAEDGVSTRRYTIALQRTGLPANVSRRDMAEMALSLADATSRSIARRLDNRQAAGQGPGLTARLRSLFPDTVVRPTSFDPVFETARVDNGWEHSQRLPGLSRLLQLADTAWSFDKDNPDAPGLWFEGSTLVGHRMDSAHAGFDAVTGNNFTAGAALSWHQASFNNNNDTALAGINPYLRWTGDNTTLDVASGLSKGHFRHKGNGYREPVEHNYLSAAFASHLLQGDHLEIALRSEMTRAQLAVGPVTAKAGRLRLAVESSATLELPGGSTLVPSLSVGARRDHGDLAGAGTGVESGAGLAWQGEHLSLSARTRLFRTALDTEWGIGAALDYRHPRGTFVTLSPSYGNAQDNLHQLWDGGLPRANDLYPADDLSRADGYAPHTQRKQIKADLRAGFTWQAPYRLGRLEPFVEARLQRRPSLRLGTHWTTPGGLTLRLAGERRGGDAGLPADHALLLEAGWRPGR